MKSKNLVFLACLAVILGMFCACEGLLNKDAEKALDLSDIEPVNIPDPVIVQGNTLAEKLAWVNNNMVDNGTYILEVNSDESLAQQKLFFSGKRNYTIRLIGIGGIRTISLSGTGPLFTIDSFYGNTLVLDENIVLKGTANNNGAPLVRIESNASTLIMNNGSKITGNTSGLTGGVLINHGAFIMNGGEISGNTSTGYTGGVLVSGTFTMNGGTISGNNVLSQYNSEGGGGVFLYGGTFTMNGGTISGNTSTGYAGGVYVGATSDGTAFNMTGGTISGNTASSYGGGVFLLGGTFNKTGGVITGYSSDNVNGNVVKNSSGTVQSDKGHAVYYSLSKYRNTTAGQTDNIDTATGRGLSANGNAPFEQ